MTILSLGMYHHYTLILVVLLGMPLSAYMADSQKPNIHHV